MADGRIVDGRFHDPLAMMLLREDESTAVERARAGTPPQGRSRRMEFELLTAVADVMVPRTIAIDDLFVSGWRSTGNW